MKNDELKLNISNEFTINGNEEQNINITLEEASSNLTWSVTGTVFDTTLNNVPIPNATVKVFTIDGLPYKHTLTDEKGLFTINDLPLSLYTIAAVNNDKYLSIEKGFSITNIVPVNMDLVITPLIIKNTIYGKIMDKNTNKAIDKADIILSQTIDDKEVLIKTTSSIIDGEYIINDINDGTYELTITKDGYDTYKISNINLTSNINFETNILLTPLTYQTTGTISGQILNNKSLPVANAFVALYNIIDSKEKIIATTYTNENGKYMFGNIVSGNYLVKAKL